MRFETQRKGDLPVMHSVVKKKARRVSMLRRMTIFLAITAILFLTYQNLTTNVWGFPAFLCQLLAVIELAFGMQAAEAELTVWIEQKETDQHISACKKFTPTRKEHILRTCLITIILAYSTFFYGAWYGINKRAGYAIRYYFAEISGVCVSVSLSCLLIWGMVCLYKKQKSILHGKLARWMIVVFDTALTLFLLALIGCTFFTISFGIEGTETVTGQDQQYTYLSVQPDYGTATQYRTNNPIYMQKTGVLLPNTDTQTQPSVPDSETQDTHTADSSENTPAQESQTTSPPPDEMRAVYQYIRQQNTLPDMNVTYTANAKGEQYAILCETTEEKDSTTVHVKYCLYDNGSKTDENNTDFEELVLEKVYPDGGYETELVDFYLVNTETLEVIDEQKSSW